jgi:GT2 family glycosyltransferase
MRDAGRGLLGKTYIIIVLYKQSLEECTAYQSLHGALNGFNGLPLMVYDNSPEASAVPPSSQELFETTYIHDLTNAGLSKAYNCALQAASQKGCEWLLLMDQDTIFTPEYVAELKGLDNNELLRNVGAIVPKILSVNLKQKISPSKSLLGGRFSQERIPSGRVSEPLSGINSGTLLNVKFLESINGFSTRYTLDMLDHWYFRKLGKAGKIIYVLQSVIYQELSVFGDFETTVSVARYAQLLDAELAYMNEESFVSKLVFRFRLFIRLCKQFAFKNKAYRQLTFKKMFRISF